MGGGIHQLGGLAPMPRDFPGQVDEVANENFLESTERFDIHPNAVEQLLIVHLLSPIRSGGGPHAAGRCASLRLGEILQ